MKEVKSELTEEERLVVASTKSTESTDDLASLRDESIDDGKIYAGDGVYL